MRHLLLERRRSESSSLFLPSSIMLVPSEECIEIFSATILFSEVFGRACQSALRTFIRRADLSFMLSLNEAFAFLSPDPPRLSMPLLAPLSLPMPMQCHILEKEVFTVLRTQVILI